MKIFYAYVRQFFYLLLYGMWHGERAFTIKRANGDRLIASIYRETEQGFTRGVITKTFFDSGSSEPIHEMFELSYGQYQVYPRSVLQSLPVKLQREFVAVHEQIEALVAKHQIVCPPVGCHYVVNTQGPHRGRFMKDPFADYERGRRRLWENAP